MFDLEKIAKACGCAKKTRRGYSCLCPSHPDKMPSLEIKAGDGVLLVLCYAGCHASDILNALEKMNLKVRPGEDETGEPNTAAPDPTDLAKQAAERQDRIDYALKLWHDASPAEGSLVEDYLRSRRLSLSMIGSPVHAVIRFHRACPRGEGAGGARGLRQPAMVALMRDCQSDRPVALHRRYLTSDGRKDGKPYTLGPVSGAAVKLSSNSKTFADDFGTCDLLHVTEGVETGMAALAAGFRPCWALGSTNAMKAFPVLFAVSELVVLADCDRRGWGQRASHVVVRRWHAAGKRASAWVSEEGGDLADTWEAM